MDSMLIIVTLALLGLSAVCRAGELALSIEPAPPYKMGDTVTIKCTVPVQTPLDMSKIVRSVEGQDYTITKKGDVETFYRRLGRYEVTHFNPQAGEVHLKISDMIAADGGNIHCLHVNSGEYADENIIVNVPVKKVELLYFSGGETKSVAEEGQVISLEQSKDGGFECRIEVEGSEYEPEVHVMVGDLDITYECTRSPDVTRVNDEGLMHITNVITFTYSRKEHDIDYNGKTLSCQVKMPEYDEVQVSAVIQVLHPPVVSCGTVQQKLGAKNVQLKCTGTMNPRPQFVGWVWGKQPNKKVLHPDEQMDGFQAHLEETGNGRYTFTLTIDLVTMDLFTKYKLEVENDVGMTEKSLKLVREEEIVTYAPEPTQQPTTKPNPEKGEAGADTSDSTSRTASVWTLVMSVATIIGATMLSLSSS